MVIHGNFLVNDFMNTNMNPHKRLRTIDFFFKPTVISSSYPISTSPPDDRNISSSSVAASAETSSATTEISTSSFSNDIGDFIGKSISDFEKHQLLEHPWQPPPNYKFPSSVSMKNGKEYKRYVSNSHLEKYNTWLVLSHSARGFYCKFCPWFAVGLVGGVQKTVPLRKLVTEPLINFKNLMGKDGDLDRHEQHKYHKEAVSAGKNFLLSFHNPCKDIVNKVNQQRLDQARENRERLIPIIRGLLFLGHQGMAIRGHRDDGRIEPENSSLISNEGNFRELLRLMVASGDETLKKHLESASANATYISKTVQNQLIHSIGGEILNVILQRVMEAKYYAIIFDETTDVHHKSQLSLVLRYVTNAGEVHEDFVGFIDAFADLKAAKVDNEYMSDEEKWDNARKSGQLEDPEKELKLTGKAVAQIVLRLLKELCLPLDKCVGIGTDSCSVMLSEVKGAVTEIQKEAKFAVRTPCFNHKLNLSLSKSNQVTFVRNAVGVMKQCVAFFDASAKRCEVLQSKLGHQLTGLCETRWVERHDGVLQFSTDLPKILKALDDISEWSDSSTSSKAAALCAALTDSSFLVSVMCLSDVLALTLPLSKLLQKSTLNLDTAAQEISNLITVLSRRRSEAEGRFNTIWQRAVELSDKVDVELKIPRRCSRQGYRANYDTNSPEIYFRLSVFIPLLDSVIADLKDRFSISVLDVFHLPQLLPANIVGKTDLHLEQSAQILLKGFSQLLPQDTDTALVLLRGELQLWREKWVSAHLKNLPLSSADVLARCDVDVYPIIHHLLQILTTLPVSNASSERSFSALRRLKTWIRSVMKQDRLTGLALMMIHRDIPVDIESVIVRFAKSGKRRLDFIV